MIQSLKMSDSWSVLSDQLADLFFEVQHSIIGFMYEQKHVTARGLHYLYLKTGIDEFSLSLAITLIASIFLIHQTTSRFFANALLTIFPFMLTYLFPLEKPSDALLLIYWAEFGFVTMTDGFFESFKGYYLLKVLLLALLHIHPFNSAQRFLEKIDAAQQQTVIKKKAGDDKVSISSVPSTGHEKEKLLSKSNGDKDQLMLSNDVQKPSAGISQRIHSVAPVTVSSTQPGLSETSQLDLSLEDGHNPMLADRSVYALSPTSSLTQLSPTSLSHIHPHDLIFKPSGNLVFNLPLEDKVHMQITNTSKRTIAWAIKSNAIPRLIAAPPNGIIEPKQTRIIAIKFSTCAITDKMSNDRIAFDYVFCPPDVKKFSFNLFQQVGEGEVRRRKNIHIKYNQ